MDTLCGSEWCPKWKECGRAIDNNIGRYAYVENWATFGSVIVKLDENGNQYIKEDMRCGSSGNYAMFIDKGVL